MSDSKEENSTPATDVKEEDKTQKSEENKTQDESSEEKDNAKDSVKDESEKGSDEEEEEVGLLDRPVEVFGCRARKQVDRLEVSFASKEKQMEIPEGKGDKLGGCPRIEFHITKKTVNDLKPFHRILFNRVGSGPEIKKNIRKFSGFTFSKDSTEYNKKKAQTEKLTMTALKKICEVIDVERKGTKEDLVNRIMEFLLHPKDSGKKVPKSKQASKDKKKTAEKKSSKKAKTKKEVSSGDSNSGEGSGSEPDNEEEEEEEEEEENNDKDNGESDEEEAPKNAKAAKGKKAPAKTVAKKTEKKEKPKKEEKKAPKATKRKKDDDSEHSEEEPSSKKAKMPSDEEIKKLVKRILDAADLQEITMKKVIKQVSDAYPDSDLSHKKAFIKSTIKSVIS